VQTFFIVEAFDPNLQLKLIPRTVQRALINPAIEDAIAGEESSCKKCFP
jgi:SET domain-containing protein